MNLRGISDRRLQVRSHGNSSSSSSSSGSSGNSGGLRRLALEAAAGGSACALSLAEDSATGLSKVHKTVSRAHYSACIILSVLS